MITKKNKNEVRCKRHERLRKDLVGTASRPRLNVYKSLKHIYAQIIDDVAGNTLVSASTMEKSIATALKGKSKSEQAYIVGEEIAKRATKKGIKTVVFDRAGYLYIGRVKSLAEGARSAGLEF